MHAHGTYACARLRDTEAHVFFPGESSVFNRALEAPGSYRHSRKSRSFRFRRAVVEFLPSIVQGDSSRGLSEFLLLFFSFRQGARDRSHDSVCNGTVIASRANIAILIREHALRRSQSYFVPHNRTTRTHAALASYCHLH